MRAKRDGGQRWRDALMEEESRSKSLISRWPGDQTSRPFRGCHSDTSFLAGWRFVVLRARGAVVLPAHRVRQREPTAPVAGLVAAVHPAVLAAAKVALGVVRHDNQVPLCEGKLALALRLESLLRNAQPLQWHSGAGSRGVRHGTVNVAERSLRLHGIAPEWRRIRVWRRRRGRWNDFWGEGSTRGAATRRQLGLIGPAGEGTTHLLQSLGVWSHDHHERADLVRPADDLDALLLGVHYDPRLAPRLLPDVGPVRLYHRFAQVWLHLLAKQLGRSAKNPFDCQQLPSALGCRGSGPQCAHPRYASGGHHVVAAACCADLHPAGAHAAGRDGLRLGPSRHSPIRELHVGGLPQTADLHPLRTIKLVLPAKPLRVRQRASTVEIESQDADRDEWPTFRRPQR
mmetsp:Transcript_33357/g.92059  ORF Transcript_33357/g.92059 Transcript_33357/m.92059 type:complete len:400 (+) Transcript_33357:93-1292(+)